MAPRPADAVRRWTILTDPAAPILTVVIPAYNEGPNIEPVVRAVTAQIGCRHEVLVVCDSAEDTTIPVVERLQRELPWVRVQPNTRGRGVLNAMRAGFDHARGELVLVTMADGSDEYHLVGRMVEAAREGADIVAASRYMPGGRQIGAPLLKSFLSRAAGLLLHRLAGVPIHDATSNFKLYRRAFLESTTIQSVGGFELAIELVVKAHRAGRRLAEVPTTWRERTAGESRFDVAGSMPHYLRWFVYGLVTRLVGTAR